MAISVTPIPAFSDNYIWCLVKGSTAWIVDPGEAAPVLQHLQSAQLRLAAILITHHHRDHTAGVVELKQKTQALVLGPACEEIPARDVALKGGERLELEGLGLLEVIATPGHTRGHLCYRVGQHLFTGDTLFAAGCGRLFEGSAEELFYSLERIAALPQKTLLYPAHEYTLQNLNFALMLEPENEAVRYYAALCQERRRQNQPTLPTTLALERQINPFLRVSEAGIEAALLRRYETAFAKPVERFAALRSWRDQWRG